MTLNAYGVRMDFYSVWPCLAGIALVLLLATTPILKWADTPPKRVENRTYEIDGLRGFLALFVVFHHGAIYHNFVLTGKWGPPPSRFYADIGQVGVAMFFMITGYLFWTQILNGRGSVSFSKLYLGRIFRIVPLYLVLVFVVLVMVGILTHWHLNESVSGLLKQVSRWLAGGVLIGGEVNGYQETGRITAYVTWTLRYEWMFYFSLFLISVFARTRLLSTAFASIGLLASAVLLQIYRNDANFAALLLFFIGMLTASAKIVLPSVATQAFQWERSAAVILCLASVLILFDGVYHTYPILVLGAAFFLIAFDTTIFGLLLTKPAKRLGDISYGIYLLQGPIFFVVFLSPVVQRLSSVSAWSHWGIVTAVALSLVLLANLMHKVIERPGIKAGQRLWAIAFSKFAGLR